MMKKLTILAALGALSGAAHAGQTINFTPGAASPAPNSNVVYDFDTRLPSSLVLGPLVQIKSPPTDGNGAPPANSSPSGTNYLSVLAGGTATIMFASSVQGFGFDWGSVDSFNRLTIFSTDGPNVVVPGTHFVTPADGNQSAPVTNGLFQVSGTGSTRFTGFQLTSSGNSFEIDNVSVAAVPEPASWAMMIGGFGFVGGALRRRRVAAVRAALA